MVPAYIHQWLYSQLEQLQYANVRQCFSDIGRALDASPWLKPRADTLALTGQRLIALQGSHNLHTIELWVSANYPIEPSVVYVDSQQRRVEPQLSVTDLLDLALQPPPAPPKPPGPPTPTKPPKLPAKGPAGPAAGAYEGRRAPAPPPKGPASNGPAPRTSLSNDPHPKSPWGVSPALSSRSTPVGASRASPLPPLPPKVQSGSPYSVPHTPNGLAPAHPQVAAWVGVQEPVYSAPPDPRFSAPIAEQPQIMSPASGPAPAPAPAPTPAPPSALPPTKHKQSVSIDLLDAPDSNIAPPISSERAAALNRLEAALRTQVGVWSAQRHKDSLQLNSAAETLARIEALAVRERDALLRTREVLIRNIEVLGNSTASAQALTQYAEERAKEPQGNLVTVSAADRAMVEAEAGDRAIDDLLRMLPKALDKGAVSVHVYLRLVRQHAREQFLHRHTLLQRSPRPPRPPAKT